MARIAIDFDETLTADGELWRQFINIAEAAGHRVICVTARRQTEENIDVIDEWMEQHKVDLPVYFTGLQSKIEYMQQSGVKVDIWIDDDPVKLVRGH